MPRQQHTIIPFPRHPWITKKTAAAHFGVSERTIDRWTQAGAPSWKLGPRQNSPRRYRTPDLEAWLEQQHGVGHHDAAQTPKSTTPTATHKRTGVPDDARGDARKGWPGAPCPDPSSAA